MSNTGQFKKNWEDLEFSDNFMFCKVMENTELCKKLLEKLLKIKISDLKMSESEKTIQPTYKTKGVRLDVYVKDSNRVFDIEMQTGNYDDLLLRVRYYQGVMDLNETIHRVRYKDLKETFIIFICTEDPFNGNIPVYTKQACFEECPDFVYDDKSHFIVYNASAYEAEEDKEVKAILKFISDKKADTSFTNELKTEVSLMKSQTELKDVYMDFMDYVEEEKDETRVETAKRLIKLGKLTNEEIAQCTKISLEEIEKLSKAVLVSMEK